jgi:hypothetical protein
MASDISVAKNVQPGWFYWQIYMCSDELTYNTLPQLDDDAWFNIADYFSDCADFIDDAVKSGGQRPVNKINLVESANCIFLTGNHFENRLQIRVARWFVVKPKIQIWVNFEGSCYGRCWYILWPFGIFYGHFV